MGDSIKSSILAKFQQFTKEKEETVKEEPPPQRGSFSQRRGRGRFNGFRGKRRHDNKIVRNVPTVGLTEQEVGITEYVSSSIGITGIIKHRFSDFQVHEIDLNGKVVVLDSKELPESNANEEGNQEESNDAYRSVLSDEQWAKLDEIVKSKGSEKLRVDTTEMNKEQRTKIHKAVKRAYGPLVCSNSVKEGDIVFINIGCATKNSRERISWPADQGRFLHFTVFKENMDTMHLISVLSSNLRTRSNFFTFAGTKDKRAKTTQRMCVKNKRAEQLAAVNYHKAQFGNYCYQHSPLRLGDLSGNKFTLAIRNVTRSDEEINEALTNVKSSGFINYFGLQRFGTSASMPTFTVGKLMLLEDWKGAINAILKPKAGITSDVQEACETYAKLNDPVLALRCLAGRTDSSIEGKILGALKKQPNSFYDALFAIPRNAMLLYLHAYQSYVWNKVVSRRIREYGLKPIVGDLIIVEEASRDNLSENGTSSKKNDENDEDKNGGSSDHESDTEELTEAAEKIRIDKVRKLTEEDLYKTSLSEVVYPLPGNDIEFPSNDIEKWYFEIMEEDGITMDSFMNSKKSFSMYGKYRKILTEVHDLEWKIVKYEDKDADLILSDADKMNGRTLPVVEDGKHKAVIMDFSLNSSVYATMLLREIMKCDTSPSYHAKLTQENQDATSEEPPAKQTKVDEESG